MAHHNTLFAQVLRILPRHEFERMARRHDGGIQLRKADRWSQWCSLLLAQLTGRSSLRDVIGALQFQYRRLYHLGCRLLTRSTLSRLNTQQPAALFEELFLHLLGRLHQAAPRRRHKFRFKNKLFSLDATTINLTLSLFRWSDYNASKGAIKVNVGLDHAGDIPEFIDIGDARAQERTWSKTLDLPKGAIVAFDLGFTDLAWYQDLTDKGVFFVTRRLASIRYEVVKDNPKSKAPGFVADQLIRFTSRNSRKRIDIPLRMVTWCDPKTNKQFQFLTNIHHLAASTIAGIYKDRWKIELFFKWLKQNLKVRSFIGRSQNAVASQIWVALCAYLMIALLRLVNGSPLTILQILRRLQIALFQAYDLIEFLRNKRGKPPDHNQNQLVLL